MFFVLSKTLGIMLLPVNLLIGLGVLGAALLLTRFATLGRRLMVTVAAVLALSAFSPVGNVLIYSLEQRFPPWNPAHGAPDGIIVLGGSIDPDISRAHRTPVVRQAPDRIIVAAELARKYPDARIVFTGGNANLISHDAKEGDYAGELLAGLGIAGPRVIIERQSRNTVENAEFSKELIKPKPNERWLLVTSAYHMPRSVGLFRKAGFAVEPYPVDWRVGGVDDLFIINMGMDGLSRTEIAIREWLGLVAYRLNGKTDALFPGPDAP
ncbi:YdcF family protein [Bradyrhizobium sp. WSM 1704]|uniref:YdcF family protein n=1 Tax=Bradyrhizobium semiaridum TaxID=2821404 RepID=UPI001CE28609|nr:YdcF family protein [Bradyrhizobium semiaridum]MCA6120678.1 YdcF family protein [Bradyrhizobium semiaridum]